MLALVEKRQTIEGDLSGQRRAQRKSGGFVERLAGEAQRRRLDRRCRIRDEFRARRRSVAALTAAGARARSDSERETGASAW